MTTYYILLLIKRQANYGYEIFNCVLQTLCFTIFLPASGPAQGTKKSSRSKVTAKGEL